MQGRNTSGVTAKADIACTKHEAPLGVRRGVGGGGGGSRIDAGATAAAGGGRNAGAMRMSGYSVTSVRQSIALLV